MMVSENNVGAQSVNATDLGWKGPGFYTRGSPDEPWVLRFENMWSDDHNTIIPLVKQDERVWDMMVVMEKRELDNWLRSGCSIEFLEDTMESFPTFQDLMEWEVYNTILYSMEANVPYGPCRDDPLACWWNNPTSLVDFEEEAVE